MGKYIYNSLSSDEFEAFARDVLTAHQLQPIPDATREDDGCKDMVCVKQGSDAVETSLQRWLVSCKNFAVQETSVGVNHEVAILDRMNALQCDGFIGFYATVATSYLVTRLKTLKSRSQKGFDFKIYDYSEIEKLLDSLDVQQSSPLIERYGIKRKPNLKVASFFSGGGGLDLGLEGGFTVHRDSINTTLYSEYKDISTKWVRLKRTRFKTALANDIEPKAAVVWRQHFSRKRSEKTYAVQSIVDLVKDWNSGTTSIPSNIDLVTGGFPCKDFSLSGKRLGFKSHKDHTGQITKDTVENNRGKLYYWLSQAIGLLSPKMFIAENVSAMESMEGVIETIQNDFQSIGDGYIVLMKKFKCVEYGIPQTRERIFFFGISKKYFRGKWTDQELRERLFPPVTHTHDVEKGARLLPLVPALTYLRGLKEPEVTTDPSQKKYSKAKWLSKGQGQTEVKSDKPGPTIRAEHHGNIEFRRLSEEHGGTHLAELQSGLPERRLTVRECARIQTFPDSYAFLPHISTSAAYKVIGNAVPPLLGFFIANQLEKIWGEVFEE